MSRLFSHVAKNNWKEKVNFKIHDITTWFTSNCNTHIAQYGTKQGKQTMKFGQLIESNKINIFLQNAENEARKLVSGLFLFF